MRMPRSAPRLSRIARLIAGIVLSGTVRAATPVVLSVAPGGKVWLEGDSTLHKYKASAKAFTLTGNALKKGAPGLGGGPETEQLARAQEVGTLQLTLPVGQLSSGEKGLDENLQKAMKAAAFPNVVFKMANYQVLQSATPQASMVLHLRGTLSMAGVERPVELNAHADTVTRGLHLVGSKALLMSDYGIKPPVLMGGLIKTADQVMVRFDVELVPSL